MYVQCTVATMILRTSLQFQSYHTYEAMRTIHLLYNRGKQNKKKEMLLRTRRTFVCTVDLYPKCA